MRLLLATTLLISFQAFGLKQFDLTIQVVGFWDEQPLPGLTISTGKADKLKEIGTTDSLGNLVITGVKKKYLSLYVTDPSGRYEFTSVYIDCEGRESNLESVRVKFSKEHRQKYFKELDNRYPPVEEVEEYDEEDSNVILGKMIGGDEAYNIYVAEHLHYPPMAAEMGIQGEVHVEFVVEKDGQVSNVNLIRRVDEELDEQALLLVRFMPKWVPTMKDGEPVRSIFKVPFRFTLE